MYENSIAIVKREIVVKKKTGIDANPFIEALTYFAKNKMGRHLNATSNKPAKSSEGEKKSVNISSGSSVAPQKQLCCPVNAMSIRNHDTELQKSDAVAMTTTKQPIKQKNFNLPTFTSDILLFGPRIILRRRLIRFVLNHKIPPSSLSKSGQELDDIVMETQSPTLKGIVGSIEKIDGKFEEAAIELKSSHVDTKVHKYPSKKRKLQRHTDEAKPSHWPVVKKLKLHEDSNSEDGVDNEHYYEKRIEKSETSNDESDLRPLVKDLEPLAVEVNNALINHCRSSRIPGPRSYVTIAETIHRELVKNKISDE